MRITWSDVVSIPGAHSCADVTDVRAQAMFLESAESQLNPDMFGGSDSERYRLARCYLVAHLCAMAAQGENAGPIQKETAFRVSAEYAVSRGTPTQFSRALSELASPATRAPVLMRRRC